jgi:hypothetical protein
MSRALAVLAAAVVTALSVSAASSAHGLQQVEVLTTSDLYVPAWAQGGAYGLSSGLQHQLLRRLAALRARDTPVKVVLIGQRVDLQDVPQYFGRPVVYADFLEQLLESLHIFDGTLVVVMPNGVAKTAGEEQPVAVAVRPRMSTKWDIDALARAALRALDREPKMRTTVAPHSRHSPVDRWPAAGVALAALAALAVVAMSIAYLKSRRESGPHLSQR